MEYLELRVHGVHGTSPGAMLGVDDGDVEQVAGDDLTGVYRATTALPLRDLEGRNIAVEAYSWGALTSGVRGVLGWVKRSLWLILLPFALVNLSYWARTEIGHDNLRARLGARAIRAAGLLLTVFFVLTPCVVFIDLGAWQCFRYGVPSCERVPHWLDFLGGWAPSQRVALASLGPVAGVVLLFVLSRTSLQRYEGVEAAPPDQATNDVLRHEHLWNGKGRTERLQRTHVAAGLAAIALFVGLHLAVAANHLDQPSPGAWLLWIPAVLAALELLAALLVVIVPHDEEVEPLGGNAKLREAGDWMRARSPRLELGLLAASAMTYAAVFVVAYLWGHFDGALDESQAYTARNVWFIVIFVLVTLLHLTLMTGGRMPLWFAIPAIGVLGVVLLLVGLGGSSNEVVLGGLVLLVVVLVGTTCWHYVTTGVKDPQGNKPPLGSYAWRGAGASVLLAAAAWIALLFTSATVVASADWLNGSDHGVGDLVSTTKVEDSSYKGAGGGGDLRATGDVVLEGARVLQNPQGGYTVTAGRVVSDVLIQDPAYAGGPSRRKGRVVVRSAETLTLPGDTVRLRYSCLRPGRSLGRCTAEDQSFKGDHVLPIPTQGKKSAVLTLDPGVVLDPVARPQVPLAVPQVLIWTPLAQLLWVLLVGVVLAWCLARFGRRVKRRMKPWSAFPDDHLPRRDRDRAVSARASAALAHRAERLLDVLGVVTSAVGLMLVGLALSGRPPWLLPHLGWTRGIADVAMYLAVALSAGLIALGSQIRRSESTRKAVGVLWDLTTFWPRAAHPLAPPCYAERVVPELLTRVRWALSPRRKAAKKRLVVLSGHSQGSLISVAVASRLSDAELAHVRMITYGSQVRGLYGRVFPGVFGHAAVGYDATTGPATLGDPFPDMPPATGNVPPPSDPVVGSLRQRLEKSGAQWVNLFRRTDPLGYRVFSDGDSRLDRPVLEVPVHHVGDPGPRVMTHSGYQHSRRYRRIVSRWTKESFVDYPDGSTKVPRLPNT